MSGGCPQPGICVSVKIGCSELIPPTLGVGRPMITFEIRVWRTAYEHMKKGSAVVQSVQPVRSRV